MTKPSTIFRLLIVEVPNITDLDDLIDKVTEAPDTLSWIEESWHECFDDDGAFDDHARHVLREIDPEFCESIDRFTDSYVDGDYDIFGMDHPEYTLPYMIDRFRVFTASPIRRQWLAIALPVLYAALDTASRKIDILEQETGYSMYGYPLRVQNMVYNEVYSSTNERNHNEGQDSERQADRSAVCQGSQVRDHVRRRLRHRHWGVGRHDDAEQISGRRSDDRR